MMILVRLIVHVLLMLYKIRLK